MKVMELIALLQGLEHQEWEIEYLDGEYGNTEINTVELEDGNYLLYEKTYLTDILSR